MLRVNTSVQSLNFDSRLEGSNIQYIILHYTACDFDLSMQILTDSASKNRVSAHYLIDEKGKIFQLVPDEKRAWHAGLSAWKDQEGLNTWSLGIELVNSGEVPFPSAQLQSGLQLCKSLIKKYKIPAQNVLGHSDIAPERKADPGELFDWKGFAKEGVGIYPTVIMPESERKARILKGDIKGVQQLLQQIGYRITCDGDFGSQSKAVMMAFQRRFYPEKIDGEMDKKGVARLIELVKYIN